jgi:hypothetical protein
MSDQSGSNPTESREQKDPDAVPKPPYEDGFICGTGLDDPEHASWTHEVYDTREEAIAAGQGDVSWRAHDEGFETARISCSKVFMPNPLSADGACDSAESDEMGEAMLESWQDKVFGQDGALLAELQETLDKVWSDFEDKHQLWSWGIWFDNVEHHEFAAPAEGQEPQVTYP